jgi:hypothetical protein
MPTSGKRGQCLELPVPASSWNWAFKETKNMTPMLEILLACLVAASLSKGACALARAYLARRRSDLKRGPQF